MAVVAAAGPNAAQATGKPMGYAYLEFEQAYSVDLAVTMDNQVFKGRNLKACRPAERNSRTFMCVER